MRCLVHPDREASGVCTSCGRAVCQECMSSFEGKLCCHSCRRYLEDGHADRTAKALQDEHRQRQCSRWSIALWVSALVAFIANMALLESASDEVFGLVFWWFLVSSVAGLVLAIIALRSHSGEHKGKATVGVVLNSIILILYFMMMVVGLGLEGEALTG